MLGKDDIGEYPVRRRVTLYGDYQGGHAVEQWIFTPFASVSAFPLSKMLDYALKRDKNPHGDDQNECNLAEETWNIERRLKVA